MPFAFGDFELDNSARSLRLRGEPLAVQPLVLSLIGYLVRHSGRVVPKDELLDALWPGVHVTEASLQRAVSLARTALRAGGLEAALRDVRASLPLRSDRRCCPTRRGARHRAHLCGRPGPHAAEHATGPAPPPARGGRPRRPPRSGRPRPLGLHARLPGRLEAAVRLRSRRRGPPRSWRGRRRRPIGRRLGTVEFELGDVDAAAHGSRGPRNCSARRAQPEVEAYLLSLRRAFGLDGGIDQSLALSGGAVDSPIPPARRASGRWSSPTKALPDQPRRHRHGRARRDQLPPPVSPAR